MPSKNRPPLRTHSRAIHIPSGCTGRVASSSSSSSSSLTAHSRNLSTTSIPPAPLRLPFDDRKRESRLLSEDDLNDIMRRASSAQERERECMRTSDAQSQYGATSIPFRTSATCNENNARSREVAAAAAAVAPPPLRISKRVKRFSLPTQFLRHKTISSFGQDEFLARDETCLTKSESFTALPRAPTHNHVALCYPLPDDDVFGPGPATAPRRDPFMTKADVVLGRNDCSIRKRPRCIDGERVAGMDADTVHKRTFSASGASLALEMIKNRVLRRSSRRVSAQSWLARTEGQDFESRGHLVENASSTTERPSSRIEILHQQHSRDAWSSTADQNEPPRSSRPFQALNDLGRQKFRSKRITKMDLHAIITSNNSQISDLKLQNSLMHEQLDKMQKDFRHTQAQLDANSDRAEGLHEENWRLKCRIEELQTYRRRDQSGGGS